MRSRAPPSMQNPAPAALPEPVARGTLAGRPLAHLLIYLLEHALSGTLVLEGDGKAFVRISLVQGRVADIQTSEAVAYLGHILFESGVIDAEQLNSSLAVVAATRRLHGQVLLGAGLIRADQLSTALRLQRVRKLDHAFSLPPETTFSFYLNSGGAVRRPHDVEAMAPYAGVWRGVLAHPPWAHVRETVSGMGEERLRLREGASLDALGLDARELAAVACLRFRPATVGEVIFVSGRSPAAIHLLLYFLAITKQLQLATPALAAPAVSQPPPARDVPVSGEYARKVSFAMNAARPPPGAVRIASPMPGGLVAARPDLLTESDRAAEAHRLQSQAELHFRVGDLVSAERSARGALVLAPGTPALQALVACLEALDPARQERGHLEACLARVDDALARDPACRRGHTLRALVKKQLEDHDGAIRDLGVAVAKDADDLEARRELGAYEQRLRVGSLVDRSLSPPGGTPKPIGLFEWLGKKR